MSQQPQVFPAGVCLILCADCTGAFLVDVFPLLRYIPEWCPGGGFKKLGRKFASAFNDMVDVPFTQTRKLMVSHCCNVISVNLSFFSAPVRHRLVLSLPRWRIKLKKIQRRFGTYVTVQPHCMAVSAISAIKIHLKLYSWCRYHQVKSGSILLGNDFSARSSEKSSSRN